MDKFDTIETSFICKNYNCKKEVPVNQHVYWTNNPNNNIYKKRGKIDAEDGIYNYAMLDDGLQAKCPHCGAIYYYEIVVTNGRFTLNLIDENKYLEHRHKGEFRILPYINTSTNDFCRDCNGDLEKSFADYYVKCKNNIEIKHGTGDVLSCYIPSLSRGLNVLRQIFKENLVNDKDVKISKNQEEDRLIVTYKYNPLNKNYLVQKIWKELNENTNEMEDKQLNLYEDEIVSEALELSKILLEVDILDSEVYFTFRSKQLDYIISLVGVVTFGADIAPLSIKNLPKAKYTIPDKDLKQYKDLINQLPKTTTKLHGVEQEVINGLLVNKVVSGFDKNIKKTKGKDFDIGADRRKKCMKGTNYVHAIGLWKEFIEYLRDEVKQYE